MEEDTQGKLKVTGSVIKANKLTTSLLTCKYNTQFQKVSKKTKYGKGRAIGRGTSEVKTRWGVREKRRNHPKPTTQNPRINVRTG